MSEFIGVVDTGGDHHFLNLDAVADVIFHGGGGPISATILTVARAAGGADPHAITLDGAGAEQLREVLTALAVRRQDDQQGAPRGHETGDVADRRARHNEAQRRQGAW